MKQIFLGALLGTTLLSAAHLPNSGYLKSLVEFKEDKQTHFNVIKLTEIDQSTLQLDFVQF